MLLEYLFPNNHNRSLFRSYLLPSNNSLLINSLLKISPIADSRNSHKEIFIVTSFYAYVFQRRKKRRRKRTRAICEIYRTISSTAEVRGKRDVSRAVWTRGGGGFVLVLIGGRSISWYRGFHAKGNPWPPLRSDSCRPGRQESLFPRLVSRSRYAIIRKRLISLRVTPRFKKRRLGFATLICLPDEQKKNIFAACTQARK